MDARVVEIRTHPTKGEPGLTHARIEVETEGLQGDRRKKAAVHLISAEQSDGVRANFVIDASESELAGLGEAGGRALRVGHAVLRILGSAGTCAGVYADVVTPGPVTVGDRAVDSD